MTTGLLFVLGLVTLLVGGELLIRGASRCATLLKISPLVVGLTVVAYGTSSPELATNLIAVHRDQLDLAVGNVVGSNIFNVLFILGASAVVVPLLVHRQVVRFDVPLMIGVSVLLLVLSLDGRLSRLDGLILLSGIIVYTVFIVRESRRDQGEASAPGDPPPLQPSPLHWASSIAMVLGGLGVLILGSRWLLDASVTIAKQMGISELVIGLTLVAAGTSLPELITSILAALRGQRDIAVGNVVGSNIYNILGILGISSLLAKDGIPVPPSALGFDMPVMIGSALACLPIFFSGHRIARWEGLLFVLYYSAYTLFLILKSTQHDQLPVFGGMMLSYVLPLTAVTLLVVLLREIRKPKLATP